MSDKDVAIKGGFWTSCSTIATMLSQILRIVILTRFLSKAEFGIVSISSMVIGLCLAFADLGFSSIVMYKHDLKDEEFSSLYWIQMILYIIIASIMAVASPLVATIYEEPQLKNVVSVSALTLVCLSIGQLYESVLQKNYQFKSIAIRNIITSIFSLFLAWYLAWAGFGVYSMILSTMFQALFYNIWNLINGTKIRNVSFCLKFKEVFPLIKMGLYQTYTRIADYFSSQLDVMIIGKLLGLEVLGGYDLAKQLMSRLSKFVRTVISQVALPIISNSNQNPAAVKARFLTMIKIVAYMSIPVSVTTAVFSRDIVRILYGVSYVDIAPLVAIFSIYTVFTSLGSFFDMLGIAKGRMDLNFKSTVYRILITTPIVFLTSLISIKAVAWGQIVANILMTIAVWMVIVRKTYPMSFKEYINQFLRLGIVLGLLGLVLYFPFNVGDLWDSMNLVVSILIKATIFIIAMLLSCRLFLKDEMVSLYKLVRRKS